MSVCKRGWICFPLFKLLCTALILFLFVFIPNAHSWQFGQKKADAVEPATQATPEAPVDDVPRNKIMKNDSKFGIDLSRVQGKDEIRFEHDGATYTLYRFRLRPLANDRKNFGARLRNFMKGDDQYVFLHREGDEFAIPLAKPRWSAKLSEWFGYRIGRPLLTYQINDGILKIGGSGGRHIDLKSYDAELSFQVKLPNHKKGLEFANGISTFLPAFGNAKYDFFITEKEAHLVERVLNTLKSSDGSRSIAIFTESTNSDILKAIQKALPRTWQTYRLSASDINSGASLVGQLEKRLQVIAQMGKHMPVILFLEGIYSLRGTGAYSGNATDVFDLLRTSLANGSVAMIGTDSPESFQESMQSSVKPLFTKMNLDEPSQDDLRAKIRHRFKWAQRAEPGEEFIDLLIDYARAFDVINPEPDRSKRLTDEALKWLNDQDVAKNQQPTKEMLDEVIRSAYGLDPSLNSKEARAERLQNLKSVLDSRIIGMDRAKQAVIEMSEQALMGFHDGRGPAVSQLLAGPRGTGKTEFVNAYAEGLGLEIERFNMSEFAYPGSQSQFIGQIIAALSKNPFSVLFFDEIEKASLDTQNILLNLMDSEKFKAQIADNVNHRMRFVNASARNATIFFATNAAGNYVSNQFQSGETRKGIRGATWNDDLLRRQLEKENMSVPLLDRIKSVLPAYPPTKEAFQNLARLIIERQIKHIENGCNCKITVTNIDLYVAALVEEIYSPDMSNREVVRSLSEFIGNAAAEGDLQPGRENNLTLKMPNEETESVNVLADPEFREKMRTLQSKMKSEIIGQDQAVVAISEAVIGYFSDIFHGSNNVLFMLLLGSTGTGKTESAKALAKHWFGSEEKIAIIPFGEVNKEEDLSKILGAPPGYIGSQEIRLFEEALQKTRSGGVILLDELSNVGGNDPARKNAILKQFYNVIEEGAWTSPATGETYKLQNRIFIGTGNDGEELFYGTSAEDIRLAIWREHNNKNELRQMLIQKGWPEALLGRATDILLMKPLLESDMLSIVGKFLDPVINSFEKFGFHLEFDEPFKISLVRTFFSSQEGARGVRTIIDTRLKSLISKMIGEIYEKGLGDGAVSIQFSLTDTLTDSAYVSEDDPKRTVTIKASAMMDGEEILSLQSDVTSAAPQKRLLSKSDALRVSLHEAGHAVVNDPEVTGQSVAMITIRGADQYLGYARYENIPGQERVSYDRKVIIHKMAVSYAGSVAQRLGGFTQDSGWAQDLKQIRSLGVEFLVNWGLESEFRAVQLDENGKPILSGEKQIRFEAQLEKMMDEARELATQILVDKWDLVKSIVGQLMTEGSIDGPTYLELLEKFESNPTPGEWAVNENGLIVAASVPAEAKSGLTCADLF